MHSHSLPTLAGVPRAHLSGSMVAIALVLAGCGSASPTTSTTAAQTPQQLASAVLEHAACMRSHGVPDFPDPHVSTSGSRVAVQAVVPRSVAASPQFRTAQKACGNLMPGPDAAGSGQSAAQREARKQDLLRFSRCLRAHGLTSFPDPTSDGRLTAEMVQAAGIDLRSPAVLAAAKACIGVSNGAVTAADVERATHGGP